LAYRKILIHVSFKKQVVVEQISMGGLARKGGRGEGRRIEGAQAGEWVSEKNGD
jgi:hypothetical protein